MNSDCRNCLPTRPGLALEPAASFSVTGDVEFPLLHRAAPLAGQGGVLGFLLYHNGGGRGDGEVGSNSGRNRGASCHDGHDTRIDVSIG